MYMVLFLEMQENNDKINKPKTPTNEIIIYDNILCPTIRSSKNL